MLPHSQKHEHSGGGYMPIPHEHDFIQEAEAHQASLSQFHKRRKCYSIIAFSIVVLSLISGFTAGIIFTHPNKHQKLSCGRVALRKEWRSLATAQKQEYIRAVQCLATKPSLLGLNQTIYDDFPYIHYRIGAYSHESAPFLPWHRYFIHIYERALREKCDYRGHLTYWDWSLDWEDIKLSPVWNNDVGFGGNGSMTHNSPAPILGGCVEVGPFSRLEVKYYNGTYGPHCLSRGFANEKKLRSLSRIIKPSTIGRLLRAADYETFNLGLELGPHNAIPLSVQGDFGFFTAPADPVFFLHHTQLDRLWWKWQQVNPQKRVQEYNGKAAYGTDQEASSKDIMPMGGLAADIEVSAMMDTESDALCYQY